MTYWRMQLHPDDSACARRCTPLPLRLGQVTGAYNYIREPQAELGIWFRHFVV